MTTCSNAVAGPAGVRTNPQGVAQHRCAIFEKLIGKVAWFYDAFKTPCTGDDGTSSQCAVAINNALARRVTLQWRTPEASVCTGNLTLDDALALIVTRQGKAAAQAALTAAVAAVNGMPATQAESLAPGTRDLTMLTPRPEFLEAEKNRGTASHSDLRGCATCKEKMLAAMKATAPIANRELSIGNWEFKISVVIAARNEADLPNTIDSIRENTDGPLEFIVVDDASDSPVPGARVRHATPRGAGYSKNHGARLATGGYLFFPDAHMRFEKGTLRRLVETAREKNGIAYCGCNGHFACRLESDDYGLFEPKWYTPEAKSGVIETTAIMGASTVISRANLERIGGWPAFPGRLGFEELALSIMARRCGLRFWSDMDISSRHQFREEKDMPYRPSQTGWHLNRVCAFRTLFEDETYKALWRPRLIESGIPEWIVESADAPEILEYGQQLRSRFVMSDSEFISFLRSQPCR